MARWEDPNLHLTVQGGFIFVPPCMLTSNRLVSGFSPADTRWVLSAIGLAAGLVVMMSYTAPSIRNPPPSAAMVFPARTPLSCAPCTGSSHFRDWSPRPRRTGDPRTRQRTPCAD
jgi:hypothetical protein